MKTTLSVTMCLLLLLPLAASAVKLYKWVDKDGKVTYQEFPPPASASKVEEKDINPDANIIHTDQPAPDTSASSPGNAPGGEQTTNDNSGSGTKKKPQAPVLQEGNLTGGSVGNSLPVRQPPSVPAPPSVGTPLPILTPPPVPSLPPTPPPAPSGAR